MMVPLWSEEICGYVRGVFTLYGVALHTVNPNTTSDGVQARVCWSHGDAKQYAVLYRLGRY